VLAEAGIRLLLIEQLPKSGIDGATFWLNSKAPVIPLSLRYDRIDYFWFTLAHELGHIVRRDAMQLCTELIGENAEAPEEEAEVEANRFAANFLIPKATLDDFIAQTRPLYGRQSIMDFANELRVHPGVVVGQLQFRREIGWDKFRPTLGKVRSVVTQSALTDGWGQYAPALA